MSKIANWPAAISNQTFWAVYYCNNIDLWATREPDLARGQSAEAITPLHIAARHLHPETARRLLEYGADPRTGNRYQKSPVEIAREHERPDLVQILQDQDRKIHR